jgi:hypothetical protein
MHAREYNMTSTGCKTIGEGWVSYIGLHLPLAGPLPSREVCDAHNASVGEKNYKLHIYEWRDYGRFCLLQDGTVLLDSDNSVIEDEQTISKIHAMRAEDRQIAEARRAHAIALAETRYNGDERAVQAMGCAVAYDPQDQSPWVREGIDFYEVGHNSTHSFYMGLRKNDDGTISTFSASYYSEEKDSFEWREVTEFRGYYGHH